jgi:hypothetical protein
MLYLLAGLRNSAVRVIYVTSVRYPSPLSTTISSWFLACPASIRGG